MSVYVCPKCDAPLRWQPRGVRSAGYCGCNPAGPVIECDTKVLDVVMLGADLFLLPGITNEIVGALVMQGISTLADVRAATDAELLAVAGVGKVRLTKMREYLAQDALVVIPW